MRLNSNNQIPPCLLQVHEICANHLHHNVSDSTPGYNLHDRIWITIPIYIGGVTIIINLAVFVDLDLDAPNGVVGTDPNLDVVIDLDLNVPIGRIQYQKIALHPANISGGERCAYRIVNLPRRHFS